MDAADVLARLDGEALDVVTLPDGSIDRRYAVTDRGGDVESRESFGRRVATGEAKSFFVERQRTGPGGQCVNAADQAAALGDDVTLVGHLDHPVFDRLPVAGVSMGEPADVGVYQFEEGAVMLTEESADLRRWTLGDFDAAVGVERLGAADAVVWANWAAVGEGTAALQDAADAGLDGGVLVFDPGDVTVNDPETVPPLAAALDALAASFRVVVSANRAETTFLGDALGVDADDDAGYAAGLRRRFGVDAVVVHEASAAVGATADGARSVPNADVEATHHVGGGDRFDAALAHGLAAGWGLSDAMALGNLCASAYVASGESATAADLRERFGTDAA